MVQARGIAAPATFLFIAVAAGGCSTARTRQVTAAHYLRAAEVNPAEAREVTRTYRIRAYVDEAFRTGVPDWEDRIRTQVARASRVTAGDFGVALEVESMRPWARPEPTPRLAVALRQLIAADPATDVDWVVGFVGGFFEDGTLDAAGITRLLGRHLVLRAAERSDSVQQMARSWTALDEKERDRLRLGWRDHFESVSLLHEWGHTLGAGHECDVKWIMNPKGSLITSRFSPGSRAVILAGIAHRDEPDRAGWAAAFRAAALTQEKAAFECDELAADLAAVQRDLDGPAAPAPPGR